MVTAVVTLFMTIGAVAQNNVAQHDHSMMTMSPEAQAEHLARLRAELEAGSSHGPVIPQPESVQGLAVQNITMTAKSFDFTPTSFTVNQGDLVNITFTVPSNDASTVGHGLLMSTYVENGVNVARGSSKLISFTATTAGNFQYACNIPDCGTGHSSMSGIMIVRAVTNPAPSISSIAPTSGSQTGGTSVTITGTGFLSGATVKFGGTLATNVTVTSTSITATTPAHAVGKVDVLVTNSDGQSATLAQGFTYALPAPTITNISPATGPTSGGTLITITGTSFQDGATVKIGASPATDVNVVSTTSITARTPLGPVTEQLTVDVVVTNPDSSKATAAGGFTYTVPPPAVISVTPNTNVPTGAVGAGPIVVTIFGAGFSTALHTSATVGGIPVGQLSVVDAVTIRGTFPTHSPESADVVVTVGTTSATLKNGFSWQSAPPRRRASKP
ncbi:MAG TPA: IPT/TIG domain-containing protein [Thermoanaerobaculia bacterium]|nr:IPT/TIG domain-containing protein [Thermoanaerobaculia bacterium]